MVDSSYLDEYDVDIGVGPTTFRGFGHNDVVTSEITQPV